MRERETEREKKEGTQDNTSTCEHVRVSRSFCLACSLFLSLSFSICRSLFFRSFFLSVWFSLLFSFSLSLIRPQHDEFISRPPLSLSLSFSLSHERMSCAVWQRATPSSYMMQQHTHEQDKTHTSPSRMHRAGYRHAAPASVYTHSLIGMPQHACTIHICIHQKKAHTRTHAQTHHTCIHTSVCIMYARE